jgi:RiboL-PSP-HEPN
MREHTKIEFKNNIDRAKNLVKVYESLQRTGKGRRSVGSTDVLRAAVVFTHSALEELFRNLFRWKLPTEAPAAVLDKIPIVGGKLGKEPEKFMLGKLADFRNEFVDNVITRSIDAYVDVLNVNNCNELAKNIEMIGIKADQFSDHFSKLESLFKRRHQIVHQADRNIKRGQGKHVANSLSVSQTSDWILHAENFVFDLVSKIPDNMGIDLHQAIADRASAQKI